VGSGRGAVASDNRQFDPRFDRAFQPGFDDQGSLDSGFPMPLDAPRASSSRSHDLTAGERLRPLDATLPAPAAQREPAHTSTPPPLVSVADLRLAMDAAAPSLDGNPWLRALWVIAAVFVVGGIAANAYSQQAFSSGGGAFTNLVLPSILAALSSWLMLSGLVAGIGAVMLHAVRWRPPVD
jgi:hypothetical protein